jgi:hypothetical protein
MDREFDARAYDQGVRDGRNEAAAEIERLRAALEEMLEDWDNLDPDFPEMRVAKARAALNTEKEKQG